MTTKTTPPVRRTFDETGRLVELTIECTMQGGMTVEQWKQSICPHSAPIVFGKCSRCGKPFESKP